MVFPEEGTSDSRPAKATRLTFLFDKALTFHGRMNTVTRLTAVMTELYRYVKTR